MSNSVKNKLFGDLNFSEIPKNKDFKEDSVREIIILPIIKNLLKYEDKNIIRSKTLENPHLKIGSKHKKVKLIPDYLLKVEDSYSCTIEAKAPNQRIVNSPNVEQAYIYAVHPEVRSTFFALCNGTEFAIYRTNGKGQPILFFQIEEIDKYADRLIEILSPNSFHNISVEYPKIINSPAFNYTNRPLPEEIKNVKKQSTRRHFGVHGYFTKQSWDVVQKYIKNYSQPGDVVLDPYGGSGVTAIEAMMTNRKAINVDINPLAIFLVDALTAPVNKTEFSEAFKRVKEEYKKLEPKNSNDYDKYIKKYPQPLPLVLPKGSDVETADQLFSDKQKAELGLLKHIILKEKNNNIKKTLLLMFSGVVTKHNLTYHKSNSTKSNYGGDASAFRYYRYRIAKENTEIDLIRAFELRYEKVIAAKDEMDYFINDETINNLRIIKGSATDMTFLNRESVDYIYTDPPYGSKIQYIDLSTMWSAWLDMPTNDDDLKLEAIEGGSQEKTKEEYKDLIAQSIREMYRVLKFDRCMSFAFSHKDPEYWHLIVETAEDCGFEYLGTMAQSNGQTSFKKRQYPFTVLSGQLIINFKKVKSPKSLMKANLGIHITQIVMQTIEGVIAKNNGATIEEINNELVVKGLELAFLDLLQKEYGSDLTPMLMKEFDYDQETQKFYIKHQHKFTSHIPLDLRVKYYIVSFMRRRELISEYPTFDEIVLEIMPTLKNGITPEESTILNVLEDIAIRIEDNKWKLKNNSDTQLKLNL